MKVLVFDARHHLGRLIKSKLHNHGHEILGYNGLARSEITKANFGGVDCVVYINHLLNPQNGRAFKDIDPEGKLNLLKEAIRNGVKQFIYVPICDHFIDRRVYRRMQNQISTLGIQFKVLHPNWTAWVNG